jgi:hypothetical protein
MFLRMKKMRKTLKNLSFLVVLFFGQCFATVTFEDCNHDRIAQGHFDELQITFDRFGLSYHYHSKAFFYDN